MERTSNQHLEWGAVDVREQEGILHIYFPVKPLRNVTTTSVDENLRTTTVTRKIIGAYKCHYDCFVQLLMFKI